MFKKSFVVVVAAALVVGLALGYFLKGAPAKVGIPQGQSVTEKKSETLWTCSMHPQIRLPKPGKCPICGMTLIPLKGGASGGANKDSITLSMRDAKLADIQTSPVERRKVSKKVRMVGKVVYNEQLLAYITARMPGRIDKLYVDFTGMPVRKGDHMAEYYSPELLVAQRELLLAVKDMKKNAGKSVYDRYSMAPEKMLAVVKKKLTLWGLTSKNIDDIIKKGKISDHVTLYSPISGIVLEKKALEGKYFKTGDRLFTVADLSRVWVILDAYESDLTWLRYGQAVNFTTVAYPGEVFKGRISFISPVLDNKTRTVKVRVEADNSSGKLKPELFVNAIVDSNLSIGGKVMAPSLAGKWICPMHPDVIRDKEGVCPICGMKLVKAESEGYSVADTTGIKMPLVIPATAPLLTGKRAVVYIEEKNSPGTFYGKTIVLGPRAGEYYIVKSGLEIGQLVVTNGNFKIDSSLQILAKPSMMSADQLDPNVVAEPSGGSKFKASQAFVKSLNMIYDNYFKVRKALTDDNLKSASMAMGMLKKMLKHISDKNLSKDAAKEWRSINVSIAKIADDAKNAKNINVFRLSFLRLTASVTRLAELFGRNGNSGIFKFHCPMAFDNKGADWLQKDKNIGNPYLGQTMPRCGEMTGEF